jgi:Na+-driven multidrug efflux pump
LGRAIITIPLITHFGTIGAAYAGVIGSFTKAIIVAVYSDKVYPMPWLSILRSRLRLHEK